jgi:HAMP domain-containing protein
MLLVLLAVIPALVLILYTASEDRQREKTKVQQNAIQLARLVSGHQERLIEEGRHLLIGLARLPELRSLNPNACCKLFADLLKQYPRYANLGAVDPDGNIFCSAVPMNRPINIGNLPGIKRTIQTRDFTVGVYQIGLIVRKPVLSLNYPVLDSSGRLQAVVYAMLDLTWFNQFADDAKLPPDSTLTLIDRNGTILVRHPNPEKWVGKSISETPLFKTIVYQQIEGTTEGADVDGVSRLYAFAPLPGVRKADAYLTIGIPTKVVFAEVNRIFTHNLTFLGLVAVFVLIAAWVGSNLFILRPVKALVKTTKQLSAGDLSARSRLTYGQGEIGQLARAFDEMAEELARHEAERNEQRRQYGRARNGIDVLLKLHLTSSTAFLKMERLHH